MKTQNVWTNPYYFTVFLIDQNWLIMEKSCIELFLAMCNPISWCWYLRRKLLLALRAGEREKNAIDVNDVNDYVIED